ncbi:hypothetical protein F4825DRAFT_411179 [Nemania diffusa]|nr:hypothetical protein F4825DRAFT_411179 [Nemania diffusa]
MPLLLLLGISISSSFEYSELPTLIKYQVSFPTHVLRKLLGANDAYFGGRTCDVTAWVGGRSQRRCSRWRI